MFGRGKRLDESTNSEIYAWMIATFAIGSLIIGVVLLSRQPRPFAYFVVVGVCSMLCAGLFQGLRELRRRRTRR